MTDTSRSLARSSRALLAALGFLLVGTTLVGCGEVKKCKRGELGCINEPPKDGECLANLTLVDGICVDPDEDDMRRDGGGRNDAGSDGGRDGGNDGGGGECGCADGELCAPDGVTCVNYCDDEPPVKAVTPPETCSDYSVTPPKQRTFEAACKSACLQNCRRTEIYCPGYVCDPKECDGPDILATCIESCPTMDASCMTTVCEGVRDLSCENFTCPLSNEKSCADIRCSDTCGDAKDGFCDDGDPFGSSYAICQYGADCGDCGPRRGPKPAGAKFGQPCVRDTACPGYNRDFAKTASWCANVPGTASDVSTCIPNCTGREDDEDACPEGYECEGLEFSDGSPFVLNGVQGYACFPTLCGG